MITYKSLTNPGDRNVNEDSLGKNIKNNDNNIAVFVVADGLGGHGAGDLASEYAVKTVLTEFEEFKGNSERFLSSVFQKIQNGLLKMQKESNKDMKTTLCTALISEDRITLCHVGDSRIYLFGKKKLLYRTNDHSVPQMLYQAGSIKKKEIRHHPDRNKLLRAMGEKTEIIQYDICSFHKNDDIKALLLCTDGFWEHLDEKEMIKALRKSENATEWMQKMEKLHQKNGKKHSKDNFSAIAVCFDDK